MSTTQGYDEDDVFKNSPEKFHAKVAFSNQNRSHVASESGIRCNGSQIHPSNNRSLKMNNIFPHTDDDDRVVYNSAVDPLTNLERLVRTHPLWYLPFLGRLPVIHFLREQLPGVFIVRQSSKPGSMALSIRLSSDFSTEVDHYLIEGTVAGVRLEGSPNFFPAIPLLLSHYLENSDELSVPLRLPQSIAAAGSRQELSSIALLGQDFWISKVHEPVLPTPVDVIPAQGTDVDKIVNPFDEPCPNNIRTAGFHGQIGLGSPTVEQSSQKNDTAIGELKYFGGDHVCEPKRVAHPPSSCVDKSHKPKVPERKSKPTVERSGNNNHMEHCRFKQRSYSLSTQPPARIPTVSQIPVSTGPTVAVNPNFAKKFHASGIQRNRSAASKPYSESLKESAIETVDTNGGASGETCYADHRYSFRDKPYSNFDMLPNEHGFATEQHQAITLNSRDLAPEVSRAENVPKLKHHRRTMSQTVDVFPRQPKQYESDRQIDATAKQIYDRSPGENLDLVFSKGGNITNRGTAAKSNSPPMETKSKSVGETLKPNGRPPICPVIGSGPLIGSKIPSLTFKTNANTSACQSRSFYGHCDFEERTDNGIREKQSFEDQALLEFKQSLRGSTRSVSVASTPAEISSIPRQPVSRSRLRSWFEGSTGNGGGSVMSKPSFIRRMRRRSNSANNTPFLGRRKSNAVDTLEPPLSAKSSGVSSIFGPFGTCLVPDKGLPTSSSCFFDDYFPTEDSDIVGERPGSSEPSVRRNKNIHEAHDANNNKIHPPGKSPKMAQSVFYQSSRSSLCSNVHSPSSSSAPSAHNAQVCDTPESDKTIVAAARKKFSDGGLNSFKGANNAMFHNETANRHDEDKGNCYADLLKPTEQRNKTDKVGTEPKGVNTSPDTKVPLLTRFSPLFARKNPSRSQKVEPDQKEVDGKAGYSTFEYSTQSLQRPLNKKFGAVTTPTQNDGSLASGAAAAASMFRHNHSLPGSSVAVLASPMVSRKPRMPPPPSLDGTNPFLGCVEELRLRQMKSKPPTIVQDKTLGPQNQNSGAVYSSRQMSTEYGVISKSCHAGEVVPHDPDMDVACERKSLTPMDREITKNGQDKAMLPVTTTSSNSKPSTQKLAMAQRAAWKARRLLHRRSAPDLVAGLRKEGVLPLMRPQTQYNNEGLVNDAFLEPIAENMPSSSVVLSASLKHLVEDGASLSKTSLSNSTQCLNTSHVEQETAGTPAAFDSDTNCQWVSVTQEIKRRQFERNLRRQYALGLLGPGKGRGNNKGPTRPNKLALDVTHSDGMKKSADGKGMNDESNGSETNAPVGDSDYAMLSDFSDLIAFVQSSAAAKQQQQQPGISHRQSSSIGSKHSSHYSGIHAAEHQSGSVKPKPAHVLSIYDNNTSPSFKLQLQPGQDQLSGGKRSSDARHSNSGEDDARSVRSTVSHAGTIFSAPWDSSVWENLLHLAHSMQPPPDELQTYAKVIEEAAPPDPTSANNNTDYQEQRRFSLQRPGPSSSVTDASGDRSQGPMQPAIITVQKVDSPRAPMLRMGSADEPDVARVNRDAGNTASMCSVTSVSSGTTASFVNKGITDCSASTNSSFRSPKIPSALMEFSSCVPGIVSDTSAHSTLENVRRRLSEEHELPQSRHVKDNPTLESPFSDGDMVVHLEPVPSPARFRLKSNRQRQDDPAAKIQDYVEMLSKDNSCVFGATICNFLSCTLDSAECDPHIVCRNVRQFMSGIKNYLVKHGEASLHQIIEIERSQLEPTEFLNIDAILEGVLHKIVLHPLKPHLYHLLIKECSRTGSLQITSENVALLRTRPVSKFGLGDLSEIRSLEKVRSAVRRMQHHYSPLKKLEYLLKAVSLAYIEHQHSVCGRTAHKTKNLPSADEMVKWLILIFSRCSVVSCEIECMYMWALFHPALLSGEASYYLTASSSAVHVLKNLDLLPKIGSSSPTSGVETLDGFIRVAIPNEIGGSIEYITFPCLPNMTGAKLCRMIAQKCGITNPEDYGLYLLLDGFETCTIPSECPEMVKYHLQLQGKPHTFAYKRHDAKIAWPRSAMNFSTNGSIDRGAVDRNN